MAVTDSEGSVRASDGQYLQSDITQETKKYNLRVEKRGEQKKSETDLKVEGFKICMYVQYERNVCIYNVRTCTVRYVRHTKFADSVSSYHF